MRAVVDIGSNSVKFVLATDQRVVPQNEAPIILKKGSVVTRLAENLAMTQVLSDESLARTEVALRQFSEVFSKQSDSKKLQCRVFATSAARDCKNPERLAEIVHRTLHHPLQIISGAEEARLSLAGATAAGQLIFGHKDSLFIEVGGASTQCSLLTPELFNESFQAGAVRCTEKLAIGKSPLSDDQWKNLHTDLLQFFETSKFQELKKQASRKTRNSALAIGGTLMMAAKMAEATRVSDAGYLLRRESFLRFNDSIRKLSPQERLSIEGIEKGREDILVAGVGILTALLEHFNIEELAVSSWGLRHGALRLWDQLDPMGTHFSI
jgi:exopolyphosphatase/guanosine-5'-triphosphate,3'-diphosphate pyrophosphatase